jgi:hypothetical protein
VFIRSVFGLFLVPFLLGFYPTLSRAMDDAE